MGLYPTSKNRQLRRIGKHFQKVPNFGVLPPHTFPYIILYNISTPVLVHIWEPAPRTDPNMYLLLICGDHVLFIYILYLWAEAQTCIYKYRPSPLYIIQSRPQNKYVYDTEAGGAIPYYYTTTGWASRHQTCIYYYSVPLATQSSIYYYNTTRHPNMYMFALWPPVPSRVYERDMAPCSHSRIIMANGNYSPNIHRMAECTSSPIFSGMQLPRKSLYDIDSPCLS